MAGTSSFSAIIGTGRLPFFSARRDAAMEPGKDGAVACCGAELGAPPVRDPPDREILQARGTSSAIADCDVLERRLSRPASISTGRMALSPQPSTRSGLADPARQ